MNVVLLNLCIHESSRKVAYLGSYRNAPRGHGEQWASFWVFPRANVEGRVERNDVGLFLQLRFKQNMCGAILVAVSLQCLP